MSVSDPEAFKPNNVVDQELPNELDNLKVENEALRQELEEARSQLATVQAESTENTRYYAAQLNDAGATIGTLRQELEEARSELATAQAENEALKQELANRSDTPIEKDLSEKADQILNFIRPLLMPKKTHKYILSKIEKILEGADES